MRLESSAFSHVGRRENNEDAYCVMNELGLFAVADGMGGYEGGEVASKLTIQSIQEFFQKQRQESQYGLIIDQNRYGKQLIDMAVRLANYTVEKEKEGKLTAMGSTIAMLVLQQGKAIIGHLGDSRVYRFRQGRLAQITRDHSLYEFLLEHNPSSLKANKIAFFQSVVTRAIGMNGPVEPDVKIEVPRSGDMYLLCTDGLTEMLGKEKIETLLENPSLQQSCQRLVLEAYQQGGEDNITAILVRVKEKIS